MGEEIGRLIFENRGVFARHVNSCLKVIESFVEFVGLSDRLVFVCSFGVGLHDVVVIFAYLANGLKIIHFEAVQMSYLDLHDLSLGFY